MRKFIDLIESYLNLPRGGVRSDVHTHATLLQNPAFNAWFKGSRVCDKDGTPLVCFHGSFADFTKFQNKDLGRGGAGNGFNSIGYWFDTDTGVPEWLAGNEEGYAPGSGTIYPCVLSIKKPLALDSEWLWGDDRDAILKNTSDLKDARKRYEDPATDRWDKENIDIEIMNLRRDREKMMNAVAHDRDDAFYRLMKLLPNGIKSSTAEVMAFKQELIDEGYDGIWLGDTIADFSSRNYKVSDWWIAFHPNQIKSLFAKEFNPDSDHINESLRSAVPWEWEHFGITDVAHFYVGEKHGECYFHNHRDRTNFSFSLDGSEDLTGGGDAFVVFATVLRILEEFLTTKRPDVLIFTAKSTEESRVSLYRNLVEKHAGRLGYDAEEGVDRFGDAEFTLVKTS